MLPVANFMNRLSVPCDQRLSDKLHVAALQRRVRVKCLGVLMNLSLNAAVGVMLVKVGQTFILHRLFLRRRPDQLGSPF